MGNFIDLTGKRFGRLTVIERADNSDKGRVRWKCRCDCGNNSVVRSSDLLSGATKSCGCLTKERIIEANNRKVVDLTGKKFNMLTAIKITRIEKNSKGRNVRYWLCKCDCGGFKEVDGFSLTRGHVKSCGCDRKKYGTLVKDMKLYGIYQCMKQRCFNKNDINYKNYGGRGISVCDEWVGKNGFDNFYKWAISAGYDDSKGRFEQSIDRIDVNKGYSPDNCKFSTMEEQCYNKRNTVKLEYNGKIYNLKELSELCKIRTDTLYQRIIRHNWSVDRAINTPVMKRRKNEKHAKG